MFDVKRIFSIIDYPITKEFFIQFWGSESDLGELVSLGFLILDGREYVVDNTMRLKLSNEEQEELHLVAYKRYIRFLEEEHQITIDSFQNISKILYFASEHSLKCSSRSDLFKFICDLYKWFIYWNIDRDWLDEYLEKISGNFTTTEAEWFTFLKLYEKVIPRIVEQPQVIEKELLRLLNGTDKHNLQMQIYNLLGIISLSKKEYDIAEKMFNNSYKLSEQLSDLESKGIALLNMNVVEHKKLNDFVAYKLNIEKIEQIFRDLDNLYYYFLAHYNFLIISFENSEEYMNNSPNLDEVIEICDDYPNLGRLYLNLKCKEAIREANIHNFMEYKSFSIMLSFQLYIDDYLEEFFSLLKQVKEFAKSFRTEVAEELNVIIEMFDRIEMDKESLFFEGLSRVLLKDSFDYELFAGKIVDPSLKSLFISECNEICTIIQ